MWTVQALKKGLRDMAEAKSAILLLWLTNLILALVIALPVFGWLGKMSHTVEAETMLSGFSLPLLFDLGRYDFSTFLRMVGTLVFWLTLCASLVGTFMSGGVLTVLALPGQRPFLEHFLAGAGRYFLRFLRLLLAAGLGAGAVLFGLNALLGRLVRMSENALELTSLLLGLGQGLITVAVATIFLLALHYARVETVVEGTTHMVGAYLRSLLFVFRNLARVFALILFFAGLTAVVYLLYGALLSILASRTWLLILLLMAAQQIAVLARSALQVGLYGAELELFRLRGPQRLEPVEEAPSETPVLATGSGFDEFEQTDSE